jgi:hypothetical protein
MNTEFHYWITGLIAKQAGFSAEETHIIAYSSQFVDDNDDEIPVFDEDNDVVPSYKNLITQTMNILLPRRDIMKIYPLFHFIPGDQDKASPRKDGRSHVLNTTPDSSYAQKILAYAIQSAASKYKANDKGGLYRLGITTHAYVDTWAHQNFVGWFDDFNAIGSNVIPDIGHADALHHPDWVSHRWNDLRLKNPNIDNTLRFLGAAKKTFASYLDFQRKIGKNPADTWDQLEQQLTAIFGSTYSGDCEKGADARIAQYKTLSGLPEYDEYEWLDAVSDEKTVFNIANDDYIKKRIWKDPATKAESHWYRFQEAAKGHMICATDILKPVFEQAGIHI